MQVYIDADYKVYTKKATNLRMVESQFFDGKCDTFIEGYRFVPSGEAWTRPDGVVFYGEMISPWKDYNELDAAQKEYERKQMEEMRETVAELDAALLDITYQSITEGVE